MKKVIANLKAQWKAADSATKKRKVLSVALVILEHIHVKDAALQSFIDQCEEWIKKNK